MSFTRMNMLLTLVFGLFLTCQSMALPQSPQTSTLTIAAAQTDNTSQFIAYLNQEKSALNNAIEQTQQAELPRSPEEYQQLAQRNQALLALVDAKIGEFSSFLANQQTMQIDVKQIPQALPAHSNLKSKSLGLFAVNPLRPTTELAIVDAQQKKILNLIAADLALAQKFQRLLLDRKNTLQLWQAKSSMNQQIAIINEQIAALQEKINAYYATSLSLQQKVQQQPNNFNRDYVLESQLLLNNQQINFYQYQITELRLQRELIKADFTLIKTTDLHTLQMVTTIYQNVINQLSEIEQALTNIVGLLKKEQPYVRDAQINRAFIQFESTLNTKIAMLDQQSKSFQKILQQHQITLKKQLAIRQSLSEYRWETWPFIFDQLKGVPDQVIGHGKMLYDHFIENYAWMSQWQIGWMWMFCGAIALGSTILFYIFRRLNRDRIRSRLSAHVYDGILILLLRNIPLLALLMTVLTIAYCSQLAFVYYQLLIELLVVWLFFRSLLILSRFILLDRMTDDDLGHDVHLYRRIKWLLLVGGWITAFMVMSHLLPLSLLLQDLFNRFFMLFLACVSGVFWLSRGVITHLLHPVLKNKKRYLQRAVMMLVYLVPITLFITAMVGLVGYMNLAWTMSSYQIEVLILLAVYVLIRGLMFDGLELISEWMVSWMTNGWLWIEVVLKPMDKILRLLLMLLAVYVMFQLFGWDKNSWVVITLVQLYHYPLVDLSGIHINSESIAKFFALLFFFIWASKWTREFCYRCIFRDIQDNGVRNSFSVFTQYGVILIGALITLRVLGFDFSGMSMVLGGLAVGMGFGLRDFASNIIGGIMLLIERPVREGDLITIDNYEGKVAHIGIRSMRVCSWDNMEVLIPNAETFNKPFTNWTHQDSIVRTVIPVKVSREDDPIMVQQLIQEVMHQIPEILHEPAMQVFLMKIDEALIEFEIRYFINVALHSRVEVRSRLLFAIMARFKADGIRSPVPPMEIELKAHALSDNTTQSTPSSN